MELKKYRKWLLVFFGIMILVVVLGVIQDSFITMPSLFYLSTGSITLDGLISLILVSVFSTLAGISSGYILGPLYLFVHKKLMGRKMIYGVNNKFNSKEFKGIFIKWEHKDPPEHSLWEKKAHQGTFRGRKGLFFPVTRVWA